MLLSVTLSTVEEWPEMARSHRDCKRRFLFCYFRPGEGVRLGPDYAQLLRRTCREVALRRVLSGAVIRSVSVRLE